MPHARIGILTGGGDCPGLNAAIRAVAKTLINQHNAHVFGIHDGFQGLVYDRIKPLSYDDVSNILTLGGTLLGTSNKDNFFGVKRNESQRVKPGRTRLPKALKNVRRHRLNGLVCIGGDGTLTVAHHLHERGIPVVGIPKTIDNDVMHTDQTFGFDTAAWVAATAIDRLHSSATSHKRVMIIEVMGRSAGWIALQAGIAGGGDVILIPEISFSTEAVCRVIQKRFQKGRRFAIVVAAEGAYEKGRTPVWKRKAHGLSGISIRLAAHIERRTGIECRATILGHLQRGGEPTPFDRLLATRYGTHAAHLAAKGQFGRMVCLRNTDIQSIPLSAVAGQPRRVPLNSSLIQAARDVGTSFGEEV